MTFYRRPAKDFDSLMRWRRNVFLWTPGGYVLVTATAYFITVHSFGWLGVRGEPLRAARYLVSDWPGLFDGDGWHLDCLTMLLLSTPVKQAR